MAEFILVGHCVPDAIMLKTVVQRAFPGASVETVNDQGALDSTLERDVVLVVNRELDGEFDVGRGGIDLIRSQAGDRVPMLLVSNFEDAQAEAEAAGAMPGFGKSNLYDDETTQRLKAAASRTE